MPIQRDGRDSIFVSGTTEYATYYGSWYGLEAGVLVELKFQILQNGVVVQNVITHSGVVGVPPNLGGVNDGGTMQAQIGVTTDTSYSWRVTLIEKPPGGGTFITNGNMEWFKSQPAGVTFGAHVAGNLVQTQTQLNFSGVWFPNTGESVATASLYYKKTTDISWTLFDSQGPFSGFGAQTYNTTVTGLQDGTQYQFRLTISRNTSAFQTTTGPIATAATLAATPTVTTEAASSVSHNSGQLNGTIDANFLATDVTFEWNGSAQRVIDYQDATNISDGSTLTIGGITYTFLEDDVATGNFSYTGQPLSGEQVTIDGVPYTFWEEVAASGGKLDYVDATNPSPLNTVTIPAPGPDGVYKFKEEVASTGGKISYLNATNPPTGRTVTIPSGSFGPGDAVYTFVSTVLNPGDVKRAGNADLTMTNLERAINNSGGIFGTDYIPYDFGGGPIAHPLFSAVINTGADEIDLTTLEVGSGGNVTLSSTESSITFTQPTGGSWVEDPGDVLIGVDADATMDNLTNCINDSGGISGEGEDYIAFDFGAGPAAHPLVTATASPGTDEVLFTISTVGTVGNIDITTTEPSITPTDPSGGSQVELPGDVLIGATEDDTFLNLERAINNLGGTPGFGNDYIAVGLQENPDVSAVHNAGLNVVDLTARSGGSVGNVVLADTSANITSTGMAGGADLPGPAYQVLIGDDADATMLNFIRAVNNSGGMPGISYIVTAAHPDVVGTINASLDYVHLTVPTNTNPALAFSTTEPTFTLTTNAENPFANETAIQSFSNDGTTPFSEILTGLVIQRKYYFRAKAVYTANGGGTLYGDELFFTTGAEPQAAAVEEEHMQTIQYDGQYGQEKTVSFTLRSPSASSSDGYYTGTAPLATDVKIFKDGVFDSTADNAPVRILSGASAIYTLLLSEDEMEAEVIDIVVHDEDAVSFRDQHLQVRTAMRLSEVDIDATNGPTDATALTLIGNGDGHGMSATSTGNGSDINAVLSSMWLRVGFAQGPVVSNKIKLDNNASAVDDFYNGAVVALLGGTGAGQARVITNYSGGSREADVDTAWSTVPDTTTTFAIGPGARPWNLRPEAELASVPVPTASYGEFLQLLFQRFAFKIDQTASAQTWYDSSGDPIFDRSVSDDGVTQTIEALANV